jgi:hypothetical protein
VAGLGHDELERDLRFAEVGGGGVAELVEVEPGVLLEEDAGAIVAEAGAAGVRADVLGAGSAGGSWFAVGQEQSYLAAPACRSMTGGGKRGMVEWSPRIDLGKRSACPFPAPARSC